MKRYTQEEKDSWIGSAVVYSQRAFIYNLYLFSREKSIKAFQRISILYFRILAMPTLID